MAPFQTTTRSAAAVKLECVKGKGAGAVKSRDITLLGAGGNDLEVDSRTSAAKTPLKVRHFRLLLPSLPEVNEVVAA